MASFLKDIYLTAFSIFFRAASASWSSDVNAGKGVACVALIESAFLIGAAGWISILFETNSLLDLPKWVAVIIFLVLCAANYYPLVLRGHGITFERGFNKLEKSERILLRVSCLAVILGVMTFFISSGMVYRRFIGVD